MEKHAKDPTEKRETLPSGVIRTEGRIGSTTHYAEFDPNTTSGGVYVAQKGAGGNYFVFEVYPGEKGAVKILAQASDFFTACKYAERAADGTLPEFK